MRRFSVATQLVRTVLVLILLATWSACSDDKSGGNGPNAPAATTKEITSFVLAGGDNPSVGRDVGGAIAAGAITLQVPNGTDVTALRPTIVHRLRW